VSDHDGGRPRPQYGEYASAEEQRARIETPAPGPAATPPASPPAPPTAPLWGARSPAQAPGQAANRVITIGLLVYGAVNVLLSVFSFFDLPTVIAGTYRVMGISGSFENVAAARTWGVVAAFVLIAGYVGTVLLSIRALRRRRASWWIPLVGAAVTYIIVSVCIAVPMMNDPTFLSYVTGSTR
jgi:hypothetical protein